MEIKTFKYPIHFTIFLIFTVHLSNGFFVKELLNYNISLFWAFDVFQFIILPLTLFYILNRLYKVHPRNYGIVLPKTSKEIKTFFQASIYCITLLLLFSLSSYQLINIYSYNSGQSSYATFIPAGAMKYPVIFYMSLSAAIVEEITYRGLPYLLFKKIITDSYLPLIYISSTTIAFTAIHWENSIASIVLAITFGLLSSWLYLQYKNIMPLIFSHFLIDMVMYW